jgi:hypothetical protein
MRWQMAGVCALLMAGTLGCPHAFKRGGTIDRAAQKDVKESLDTVERDCTDQERALFCPRGQEDSEECRQICG